MPLRGEVYYPNKTLPPGQDIVHQCVVLSPTNLMATHPNTPGNRLFVTVAIIRSATHKDGRPVRLIKGHSFPISSQQLPALQHDSIIETHQLFAVELDVFRKKTPIGTITNPLLADVLAGAKLLFS